MRRIPRNMVWVTIDGAGRIRIAAEHPSEVQVFVGTPEAAREVPAERYRGQMEYNAMMYSALGLPEEAAVARRLIG